MPSSKDRGELTEARFLVRAMDLGLTVSKPFGDNARYDFIVDFAGSLTRVQVKSATLGQDGGYRIGTASGRRSKHPYTGAQVDLLAAHLVAEDLWYLIPVSGFAPRKTIRLYPHRQPPHRFEQFREAWRLLTRLGSGLITQRARAARKTT